MKENTLNLTVLITLLLVYSILLAAPGLVTAAAFTDTGTASFINIALIGTGLGLCVYQALDPGNPGRRDWLALAFVYMVYLMREADFHTGFSGESLTKMATYGMAQVPLGIRIVAAAILLSMVACLVYLLVRHTKRLLAGIRNRHAWAIAFALWFLLLLISQIFDRKISTSGTHWKLTAIEELLELSAAVFALLAILQARTIGGRAGHKNGA